MNRIYLEQGTKKLVAASLDWPGWARIAGSEPEVIAMFDAYADRYEIIAKRAGLEFAPGDVEVVSRVVGASTTDWGAPAVAVDEDAQPYSGKQASRAAGILQAAWQTLDELAVSAPITLLKGPRGGGRDRDEIVAHVIDTERVYARKLGIKAKPFHFKDQSAVAALRASVLGILGTPGGSATDGPWLRAYAARRFAWHVLDHVWEIQDKS